VADRPRAKPTPPAARHVRLSDVRAVAQLAVQATIGVSRVAEGVHQSVRGSLGLAAGPRQGQTRGITGLAYRSVEGIARMLGHGADGLLASLEPLLASDPPQSPDSPQRAAVLAILNGVMGDRLAASGSPLATPMALRLHGADVVPQSPPPDLAGSPRLILLVHGLCMNDLQWQVGTGSGSFDHGARLGQALQAPVLYLRYNSGRHVSENGADLAGLLEQLLARTGATPQTVSVVAHSMGGLVVRSAIQQALQHGMGWQSRVRDLVFLGTPHHGAPLERAGSGVDALLGSTPWSAPFARLGQLRSAGITDLRHGSLSAQDWQGRDRFHRAPAHHLHVPLPEGTACYTVAATLATKRSRLADRLVGDGLVPLRSALGQHDDPLRTLAFAHDSRLIAWRTGHMELLRSKAVSDQLLRWLA
jgi:hypothetical protein